MLCQKILPNLKYRILSAGNAANGNCQAMLSHPYMDHYKKHKGNHHLSTASVKPRQQIIQKNNNFSILYRYIYLAISQVQVNFKRI